MVATSNDYGFGRYSLDIIKISSTNRKRFNPKKMQEMEDSVRNKGVIQPILLRPTPYDETHPLICYEIVAGERRFVASQRAGRSDIIAMVRDMTDTEAAELQLIENLHREDEHPLEEAERYEQLMMKHGHKADDLAKAVGKSRTYIYNRLKYCALIPDLRDMFFDGEISESVALLLARIPVPELQKKAADEITNPAKFPPYTTEPMSYRRAAKHVQDRFMLSLLDAPFPIKDAKLLPAAGSCEKCPKLTGNQPEVFEGISSNICTDPDCFSEKLAAVEYRKIDAAKKKGIPVLEGDEADEYSDLNVNISTGDVVDMNAGTFLFSRMKPEYQGKCIEDLIDAKSLPQPAKMLAFSSGEVQAVFDKTAIQAALEKAGLAYTMEEHTARMKEKLANEATTFVPVEDSETVVARTTQSPATSSDSILADDETAFRIQLYKTLRAKGFSGFSLGSLRAFVKMVIKGFSNLPSIELGDIYDFDASDSDAIHSFIDTASLEDVQLLLVDTLVSDLLTVNTHQLADVGSIDDQFETVIEMAECEGIDWEEIRRSIAQPQISDIEDDADTVSANWPFKDTMADIASAEDEENEKC